MNVNNRIAGEALSLNPGTVDAVALQVESFGDDLKMERSNLLRTRLSVEEILLRWMEHFGEETPFYFSMGYRWRQPYISLELSGEVCNPLLEENREAWGEGILERLGIVPRFTYERGKNCIYFRLERPRINPALKLMLAIAAAVLLGAGGRAFLSLETLTMLVEAVLTPVYNAFFRMLNLASGPVVFLSVLAAVYEVGSLTVLGNLWTKMSSRFVGMCLLLTGLSAVLCIPLFSLEILRDPVDYTQFSSVLDLLLHVIPNDILTPFLQGDFPSLILLAILFGDILLFLGRRQDNGPAIAELAGSAMMRIVDGVNLLGGWVIVVVLLLHIWSDDVQGLLGLWRPVLLCAVLSAVYLGAMACYIGIKERVPLGVLLKKLRNSFLLALTTGSVAAAHGENVSCCEKHLGISSMVTRYGIPLGSTIYMPGVAINALLISLYMAEQWNVAISLLWIVTAVILASILAIAAPPISGAGLLTYAAIFTQLGIPTQALAVALVADILMGFIAAALDQTLLQMELILQADRMQLLDKDMLREDRKAVHR